MSGTLYITATPIGNLKDITLRALEVLKDVDVIAAEDTRRTIKLLNHYEIKTKLISYYEHNKMTSGHKIIERLLEGKDVALVSDAGMPCVSDPGWELVNDARKQGITVTCLPGASALPSAIALCGLDATRFIFEGFLPRERKDRVKRLNALKNESRAVVFYESPFRVKKTIEELSEIFSTRRIAIVSEISKLYERVDVCLVKDAMEYLEEGHERGEFVLVVESGEEIAESWEDVSIESHIRSYMDDGMGKMDAVKAVAKERGMKKADVYKHSVDL